jgi:hypothetical protein
MSSVQISTNNGNVEFSTSTFNQWETLFSDDDISKYHLSSLLLNVKQATMCLVKFSSFILIIIIKLHHIKLWETMST